MARDETLTLAFGPGIRRSLQRRLIAGMRQRYPGRAMRVVILPRPVRSVIDGPVLAFLGLADALPAADPPALGWVVCSRSCDARSDALWRDVGVQLARLDAPIAGDGPTRRYVGLMDEPTRGELLRLPLPRLLPLQRVPRLEATLCHSAAGCRACADACPSGAISIQRGHLSIAEEACRQCGRCVAACPTGALESAVTGDAQWLAALSAARADAEAIARLRLTCRPLAPDGRPQMPVACVAEIADARIREARAAGVAVDVVCPVQDCPLREYATHAAEAGVGVPAVDFRELAALRRPQRLSALQTEPFGLAAGAGCTLCGICAQACAAHALLLERQEERERLVFDPGACAACAACLPACPTGALGVSAAPPGAQVAVLRESPLVRCSSCGAQLAPQALWQGLRTSAEAEGRHGTGQPLCPACRSQTLWQRAGTPSRSGVSKFAKGM